MNRSAKRTLVAAFSTIIALTALGCGSDPLAADADAHPKIGSATQALWSGYHGGSGGWAYSDQLSTTHDFAGWNMRCGSFVDNLDLELTDGIGYYYRLSGRGWGGSGGTEQGWNRCPPGQFIVGIYGRSGQYVDQLGFYCGTADHSTLSPMPSCGGSGGDPFDDVCPPGQVMRNYWIRAGAFIDGIQINCDAPYYGQIIY